MASTRWVWLARVKRTQGRKGEVFAEILTDFPEKFAERRRLWLLRDPDVASKSRADENPREVMLVHHWLHKGGIVLHFAGVDSISSAEELAGLIAAIPQEQRAALAEDELYIGDLIGCAVVDVAGAEPVTVGEIEDVDRSAGPVAILVVRGKSASQPSSDEILIPFAKEYLRLVDVEAKRVEMSLPEGLVDLNEAKRGEQS
jgi:16S rRNA processing protein RimM